MSADLADRALARLRYPNELRRRVVRIVRAHMLDTKRADALRARKLLARFGDSLLSDLLDHKESDLRGKGEAYPAAELEALQRLRTTVEHERASPHRLRDLAIDGNDLIRLGYRPGPGIGRALAALLEDVIRNPELNAKEELLRRARKLPR